MSNKPQYSIELDPAKAESWAKEHTNFKPEKLSYEEFRNFCVNYSFLIRKMRGYLGMVRQCAKNGGFLPSSDFWPANFLSDARKALTDFEVNLLYAKNNYPELVPLFSENEVTLYRLLYNAIVEFTSMTWVIEDEDKLIDDYLDNE